MTIAQPRSWLVRLSLRGTLLCGSGVGGVIGLRLCLCLALFFGLDFVFGFFVCLLLLLLRGEDGGITTCRVEENTHACVSMSLDR